MSTLLLKLSGPMQSWGCGSHFETRRTEREPTKSGVIGLIAAALGRRRNEPIDDLNMLNFGVRIDKEGVLLRDFHTAKGEKSYVTNRYYLCDATFLVGLESSDEVWLKKIEYALLNPVFPLFLGRRSCVPDSQIVVGIRDARLIDALRTENWQISEYMQKKEIKHGDVKLRIITDTRADDIYAIPKKDLSVSFNPECRMYAWRPIREWEPVAVKTETAISNTHHDIVSELNTYVTHDAMSEL